MDFVKGREKINAECIGLFDELINAIQADKYIKLCLLTLFGLTIILGVGFGLSRILHVADIEPALYWAILAFYFFITLYGLGFLLFLTAKNHQEVEYSEDNFSVTSVNQAPVVQLQSESNRLVKRKSTQEWGISRETQKADKVQTNAAKNVIFMHHETEDPFSSPEAAQRLQFAIMEHLNKLDLLISDAKVRISKIDRDTIELLHSANAGQINSSLNIKRILSGLELRHSEVYELCISEDTADIVSAEKLLFSDLVLPRDTVNTLLDSIEIPALPHSQWEGTLKSLFSLVEKKTVSA